MPIATRYVETGVNGWCDVRFAPDGFRFAYAVERGVVVEDEQGGVVWQNRALPESLLYVRLDDTGDVVVGQGQGSGEAYFVAPDGYVTFGPCHGQDCITVSRSIVYTMRPPNGSHYDVGVLSPFSLPCWPTSQGFAGIVDGWPVFRDAYFLQTLWDRTLVRPTLTTGKFVFGQSAVGLPLEIISVESRYGITVFPSGGFEPSMAYDPATQRYAFCARIPGEPRRAGLAILTAPYPPDELFTPIEEPEEPMPTLKKGTPIKLELRGIRTADGRHLICAEEGGGGEVNATRVNVGSWETFKTDAVVLEDVPVDPR